MRITLNITGVRSLIFYTMYALFRIVVSDLEHYCGHSAMLSRKRDRIFVIDFFKALLDIDFRIVFLYRLSVFFQTRVKWLSILMYYRIKSRYSCDLSPYARIGPGLRFVHGFGIVIGSEVVMGANCVLFAGVVLGNVRPDGIGFEMPIIGSQVILGAGCKILGAVQIENLKLVGANVVLTPRICQKTVRGIVDIYPRE